jgi:hypothetical protein
VAKVRGGGFVITLIWSFCLVVLALLAAVGLVRYGDRIPIIESIIEPQTSETVVQGVRDLNELATAEITAQVVIRKSQNARFLTQPLPEFITGEEVLLIAEGEVEAGIDLGELDQNDIRVQGEKVAIDLPDARILDANLDEEETELYDWDRGLLVQGDYTLIEEARLDAIDAIEEAAREEELLQKAQKNAEDSIRGFVQSLGYEEVVFT